MIADIAIRQTDHGLGIILVVLGRNFDGIRDDAVIAVEAEGADVARPAELDRRRAMGKERQAIARRVSRQIEQDVDTVVGDMLDESGVIDPGRIAPSLGDRLEAPREVVFLAFAVRLVAEHVVAERRELLIGPKGEKRHGVTMEISRNQA
jgi:hypothetical protein